MAYKINWVTKRGGHSTQWVTDFKVVKSKMESLFKQRTEATAYNDGILIGRVYKASDQVRKWNFFLETGGI